MKLYNLHQRGILRFIAAFVILSGLLGNAKEQTNLPVKRDGLTMQLISDQSVIKAGEPFRVGLHIRHDKGFHTYWRQPGVVGIATSFEWSLPEGFTVSEISWPYPELSDMAGHPCHGYERDVTLFATITPPKSLPETDQTIGVEAAWMCCAADCFPGFQDLSLKLSVGEKSQKHSEHYDLIEKASKEVPTASELWLTKLLCQADTKSIVLEITAKEKLKSAEKVYLFSTDGQVSSDKKQVFQKIADGKWTVTLERSELSPKGAKGLPAILQIDGKHVHIAPQYQVAK